MTDINGFDLDDPSGDGGAGCRAQTAVIDKLTRLRPQPMSVLLKAAAEAATPGKAQGRPNRLCRRAPSAGGAGGRRIHAGSSRDRRRRPTRRKGRLHHGGESCVMAAPSTRRLSRRQAGDDASRHAARRHRILGDHARGRSPVPFIRRRRRSRRRRHAAGGRPPAGHPRTGQPCRWQCLPDRMA